MPATSTSSGTSTATQYKRLMVVDTPLKDNGKEKLLINHLSGRDGLSQLFRFQLSLLSTDAKIDPVKLIGQSVTVSLQLASGERYFNGIVSRFTVGETDERFSQYEAEVVPWLWLLTQTSDCWIFQDKTVPEIIDKVFKKFGFAEGTHYRKPLTGKYTKWDYCVQYRETAFNFVTRLMEQEGIFYFFEHEKGKHRLVLADSLDACKGCPGQGKAKYQPVGGSGETPEDTVESWEMTQSYQPGKYTYRDYHFQRPETYFEVHGNKSSKNVGNDKHEMFDYPGEYALRFNKPGERLGDIHKEGEKLVKFRMEEEETPLIVISGSSDCRAFTSGGKFALTNHPTQSDDYVLTSVQHSVPQNPDYHSNASTDAAYHNSFTCVPDDTKYRPTRLTPKPVVQGLQNAVVVGLKGKEIDVDKFGRIKVQFPWDREGKKDENSSCWLRVSQPWAGKRWGAFFWPRIGQEVLVAFMEGDPDHPIVVGSVYNAEQMPPYLGDGLDPKHKHDPNLTGVKSNTTLGGVGFNEWRFDDTKGKEEIFFHAERDMDVRVKHDNRERVIHDRHLIVGWEKDGDKGGDQREMVYQDKHLDVKRDQIEQIEGNYQLTVGKGEAKSGGNLDVVIEKNRTELVGNTSDLHVQGARNEKIDGGQSLTVGKDQNEKVGQNHALEAGQVIHLKGGTTVVIEAGTQLSLKVGGNFITIDASGVSIQGTMVKINSGGSAGSGPGASPQAPQHGKQAKPTKPAIADESKSGSKSGPG